MRVWPFKPLTPLTESLEWATDIFRAKASEQRIALRVNPRRVFQMSHFMRDAKANYARTLIRNAQADGGFLVPDWTQVDNVGAVAPGTAVNIPVQLESVYYGERALLWESETNFESLDITWDSNGITADVSRNYSNAVVMPLWLGDTPDGLTLSRRGSDINTATIGFVLTDDNDLSSSSYSTYRGHDVIPDCPVISSGSFEESIGFPLSTFSAPAGDVKYLRARDLPDNTFQMRWHEFSRDDVFTLRQWLHSRRGRQKAFWLSSYAKDYEPVTISGTNVTVYNDILTRPAGFDIEIVSAGVSYYRQALSLSAGTPVGGRPTVDITVDSSVPVSSAERISNLLCARFDADRIDMRHQAKAGTIVQVPCREVPVP